MPSGYTGAESIMVTGGAGFIGSAVVRHLVRDTEHSVVTLDKLTYAGNKLNLADCLEHPRHKFVCGDITDRDLVRTLLSESDIGIILHLAAESHVDRSIDSPGEFINTNIVGTYVLLEEFYRHINKKTHCGSGFYRFCHVSTDEVYGSLGPTGLFTESTPYDPSSPYSASKAASDHLARAWARTYKLPVVVTNCSNNYGPYQHPEKLIPLTILNALEGKPLPIYGDGSNVRDWLFVEDHADALFQVSCGGRPGETYNIGGKSERTNLEVVKTICDVLDELRPGAEPHHDLIEFVADRPGHDQRYAIDSSKVEKTLGWRPHKDFEAGIRRTIDWYMNNWDWTKNIKGARVRRGLGDKSE
jgi:dTDP-glucose 4,6-dehydratase